MQPMPPPDGWSASQAVAVLDYLEELHRAVWDKYHSAVVPLYIDQMNQPGDPPEQDDIDDDIPF